MRKAHGPGGASPRLPPRRLRNPPHIRHLRRLAGKVVPAARVTIYLSAHCSFVNKRSLLNEHDCLTFPLDQAL